ncbi:response regulator transcription factor [Larkinella sp. VNQ87]|uniref:response regulator transcription factor n=1 Tax=Larkinella sp. VNQ87 TaxID=3400921 RepID=UPI003C009671
MENASLKPRILVVEDDAPLRRLLIHRLSIAGYGVMAAQNGLEAVSWLGNPGHAPDVVLLDIFMPIYSGLDVLAKIKSMAQKMPVILMSQAEMPIAREAVRQASPDAFLAKPFKMEELLTLLGQFVAPVPA